MNNKKLQEVDKDILKNISKNSGLNEFYLGGSLPYLRTAKKIGIKFVVKDYDLAIIGTKKDATLIERKLKKRGFEILVKRPYFLKYHEAFQIMAKKNKLLLDIAIVKDLKDLGHFNWESIFWEYPSEKIIDENDSLRSIPNKKLRFIVALTEENPLILTSRFLNLCARFNLDIKKDKYLSKSARELSVLVSSWNSKDKFHGLYALEHSSFGILKSILRSKDRIVFIEYLIEAQILKSFFPEIKISKRLNANEIKKINSVNSIRGLVRILRDSFIEKKDLNSFNGRIDLISHRF